MEKKRALLLADKQLIEREINKQRSVSSSIYFGYDPSKLQSNLINIYIIGYIVIITSKAIKNQILGINT